jgi:hypothetical protein
MTWDSEKAKEPLVEVRQLAFAKLFRDPDEAEERQQYDQHGHEYGRLLSGEPSHPSNDAAARGLCDLPQSSAAPKAPRRSHPSW